MNIRALATDYDGTIARHGLVEDSTVRALEAFQDSGRKLIMVTGRELPELLKIFPAAKRFDLLVAENGGLLYDPATERRQLLGPEPNARLIECLRQRGVHPLSIGHSIIATQENYLGVIEESVAELGLHLNLIPN